MTAKSGVFYNPQRVLAGAAAITVFLVGVAGCSRTPEQKADKFIANGKSLMEKKEYVSAILEFKNAARLMPKSGEAFYQLSLAYLYTGDFRASAAALRHASEVDPKHQPTQLKLAEQMSGARNATPQGLNEAEKIAEAILVTSPDNPDALSILALAEFRLGRTDEARKHLEDALAKFPDNLRAARTMALLKISTKDLAGAEEVLKKTASQTKSVEAELALGRFYLVAQRPADAESAFQRAVDIDPKNGPALRDLASMQRLLGKQEQAEKTFRLLSALPDKEYRPLHAMYQLERGKHEEAIREFEQLAKDDPKDPLAAARAIRVYLQLKRFPEAEKAMAAALKKNPKQTAVLVERARLYLATGRIQEAVQDLNQALQFEPGSAEAHYLLAKAHQSRGEEEARRQELAEAVKYAPAHLAARLELAQSLSFSKGAKTALEYLSKAPRDQQRIPALIAERNWALFAIGDKVALRKSIDEGLAVQKTPELVLQDAYLRLQNKDSAGGREALRKVLELSPEEGRALDALGKSYLVEKKPALALAAVKEYASKHEKSAWLQYVLGEWLLESKKLVEARSAFEAALRAAPQYLAAEQKLADLDIAEGKIDSARQRLARIAAAPGGKALAELSLGIIEERPEGNPAAAIGHYRKVLEADPKNLTALNNLAYHLANDSQQFDEALKVAQQVKELSPKDAFVDDTIGWAYYNKGLFDTAVKYFEAAVDRQPNARRQYHLAMAYFKVGKSKRAQAVLVEARKLDPTLPESAVADQLLANSRKVAN